MYDVNRQKILVCRVFDHNHGAGAAVIARELAVSAETLTPTAF